MTEIIVGVDESEGAAAALRWAVREGELRVAPVTAVMAWSLLDQHPRTSGPFDARYGEDDSRAALDCVVADVLGPTGFRDVGREVVGDLAAPALVRRARPGDLLVVGARGLGGFRELLLGSVSHQCLQHARSAVAVVRDRPSARTRGLERVVVGVDGSEASTEALAWAADEARRRGALLTVVHAYLPPNVGVEWAAAWDPTASDETARAVLDRSLQAVDTSGLPAAPDRRVVPDGAAPALLTAAEGADLIVLGSRGVGGFKGLLLGSVSHHVTHHARCPVVVLRRTGDLGS